MGRAIFLVLTYGLLLASGTASAFSIEGKYSYKEDGCSGSMEIQEVSGMDPHIIAKIETVCTDQAHTCELTARGTRIISTDNAISANFEAAEDDLTPAKFDIEFNQYGAKVAVEERGAFCGLNGSYSGTWSKDGVKQPTAKNMSKEVTQTCSDYMKIKKDCYSKAKKGVMASNALKSLKKTSLPEDVRDNACRDGYAAFGRAGSVKNDVLNRALQEEFTQCYEALMKQ